MNEKSFMNQEYKKAFNDAIEFLRQQRQLEVEELDEIDKKLIEIGAPQSMDDNYSVSSTMEKLLWFISNRSVCNKEKIIEQACQKRWDASPAHIKWDQIPEKWKHWHRGLATEIYDLLQPKN